VLPLCNPYRRHMIFAVSRSQCSVKCIVFIRACVEDLDPDYTLSCFSCSELAPGRGLAGHRWQQHPGTNAHRCWYVSASRNMRRPMHPPHHMLCKPVSDSALTCFLVLLKGVTCQTVLLAVPTARCGQPLCV